MKRPEKDPHFHAGDLIVYSYDRSLRAKENPDIAIVLSERFKRPLDLDSADSAFYHMFFLRYGVLLPCAYAYNKGVVQFEDDPDAPVNLLVYSPESTPSDEESP